jgi:hypothetical protein
VSTEPRSAVSPRVYAAVILGVFVLAAAVLLHWLLRSEPRLAGTNSVNPAVFVFSVPKGQTMCLRDLILPKDANQVQLLLVPNPGSPPTHVSLQLRSDAGYRANSNLVLNPAGGGTRFPIPGNHTASPASLCATTSEYVSVSGFPGVPASGRVQAFVDHKPQTTGRASVWFVDSHKRTLLGLMPTAAHRASVFRAGFVGPWVYLLALLVLPLLWWFGLRRLVGASA